MVAMGNVWFAIPPYWNVGMMSAPFAFGENSGNVIPYVDRSPGTRPSERKTAVVLFSIFAVVGLVVTFFGIFFRGAGYSASLFWVSGLHFSL